MTELEKYKILLNDMCEFEREAREIAGQVLTELECQGDSWGVPTIADVVETLVNKIKDST